MNNKTQKKQTREEFLEELRNAPPASEFEQAMVKLVGYTIVVIVALPLMWVICGTKYSSSTPNYRDNYYDCVITHGPNSLNCK